MPIIRRRCSVINSQNFENYRNEGSCCVEKCENLKTWSDITLRSGELYEVTSWIANFTYLPTVKFQYCRSKSKTRAKHTAATLDRRVVLDHLSKNLGA